MKNNKKGSLSLIIIMLLGIPVSFTISKDDTMPHSPANVPKTKSVKFSNRLINEASPYLLQHAHNPVDWYPWGDEALNKAKNENKPIFLSIGYSACHWCHVMEHESFENKAIAKLLNKHFVSIKVDREERPDLDEIYMTSVQIMTGSGGWPMSVFLTPELKPFYGGTYFPPEDKYGRPGFKTVLNHLIKLWEQKKEQVINFSVQFTDQIRKHSGLMRNGEGEIRKDHLEHAAEALKQSYDHEFGGFGDAPKFPPGKSISFLLRYYNHTNDKEFLNIASTTLQKMAYGGMYDQIGGGFHRYSVDDQWLVPHFEKMLYDNALLSQVYLEAYQLTKNPLFKRICEEVLSYVATEMTSNNGGFYSSEDADSEGKEGIFYIWDYDELMEILGDQDGELFCRFFNIKRRGNFSSHEAYHKNLNIPHISNSPENIAREVGITIKDLQIKIDKIRTKLFLVRNQRVHPGKDDKIITAWNSLMISSYSRAYQILENDEYLDLAKKAANFILEEMVRSGELFRIHRKGITKIAGNFNDYSYFITALIDLYEADFDIRWLKTADEMTRVMISKFWDDIHGGFYFTEDKQDDLIVRTKPTYDGAVPSGNSMAAMALFRLAKLLDNESYFNKAEKILKVNSTSISKAPRGYMNMLSAVDFYLFPPKEIAIVGQFASSETKAVFTAVHSMFIPNKVLALYDSRLPNADELVKWVPLLKSKSQISDKTTVFVCKNFTCKMPVTSVEKLITLLEKD